MLQLKSIKLSCISYITEESELVERALLNCVPENLEELKVNTQKTQSQFGDNLIIFSINLKNKVVKQVLNHISDRLTPKSKLKFRDYLQNKIDLDDKTIHIRLDKFDALDASMELTRGNDVIKVVIKYAVYTSNDNTIDNVLKTLADIGIFDERDNL